jgi:hypothetical protein
MAIDTAARRRNVNRMTRTSGMMGLAPSAGLNTADRVNAGRAYIGLTYQGEAPPEPEPDPAGGGRVGPRRKSGIGKG